jgi:hypothetical protein
VFVLKVIFSNGIESACAGAAYHSVVFKSEAFKTSTDLELIAREAVNALDEVAAQRATVSAIKLTLVFNIYFGDFGAISVTVLDCTP